MVKGRLDSRVLTGFLVTVTLISAFSLSSVSAVDTVNSNVHLAVPVSCNISGTIDTPHTKNVNPGTYNTDIGTTTFEVLCNDSATYSIYAIGYSNEEYGNTKLLATVGGILSPSNDIVTGLNTSSGVSNWSMKLQGVAGHYPPTIVNNYDNYNVVPTNYTKVATLTSTTGSTIGSQVQSTYAVFAATDQPAGTYNGKVKYTLVHPDDADAPTQPVITASGKICYYPNANTYEGTMGCQTVTASATSARLFASNFSRTGYGFAGWSDAFDYETNPNAHFYGPNENITFTAGQYTGSNPGLSLYAVWVKSAGNFQDSSTTATVCNGLTAAVYNNEGDSDESTWSIEAGLSSISALTDTRDNQTYAIAKLTDGKCWMIENLRLADTHQEGVSTVPTTLTVANTNNPLNDNDPDNPTVTLKHNYTDSQTFTNLSATSSVAYNADTAPDGWCTSNSAACDDQSRLRTDNTASRVTYTSGQTMSHDANLYSYGNYYNWYSATAGRGTYSTGSGVTTVGDLCPAGWHLPTGTGSGEFGLLSNSLGGYKNASNVAQNMSSSTTPTSTIMDNRIRHFPNNFVYSGYVNVASLNYRGSLGRYWSSTAYSSAEAYNLYFGNSGVGPGKYFANKYYGGTVRCVVSSGA